MPQLTDPATTFRNFFLRLGQSTMTTTSRLGVSMPMLNQPYEKYPEFAKLADKAGLYSLWDYEFYRNPFITHALCGRVTKNIKLGTGIAAASGRAANEMANAAADVDELSKGRAILGLSTGGAGWADCYNGSDVDQPLPRMREYIYLVRSVWRHHASGEPFEFTGRFYKGRSRRSTRSVSINRSPTEDSDLPRRAPVQNAAIGGRGRRWRAGLPLDTTVHQGVCAAQRSTSAPTKGRTPARRTWTSASLCCVSVVPTEKWRRAPCINVGMSPPGVAKRWPNTWACKMSVMHC